MNILEIEDCSVENGIGIRIAIYFAGCLPNKCKEGNCPGCHNKQAQNFNIGEPYTAEIKQKILKMANKPYISGITLVGGEPFDQDDQILDLVKSFRELCPEKNVWVYTGYEFDQIKDKELAKYIDIAVVGPFILAERDITDANRWRGSKNQRVLDLPKSLETGKINLLPNIPNNE